jgi:putative intracellular protease/amidase
MTYRQTSGLHHQVRKLAQYGLTMEQLKPNSKQIAKRMIEQGELIKSACGGKWILAESLK